jgi:cytochrome P450
VPDHELPFLRFLRTMRRNALEAYPRAYYEARYARRLDWGRPSILLNDPDAIQHVLVRNSDNYMRTAVSIRVLRPIIGNGLLLAEGDAWKLQRRTIAPTMAPRVMPTLARHVLIESQAMVRTLAAAPPGEPRDLRAAMQALALGIAGRSMFSLETAAFGAAMRAFMMEYTRRMGLPRVLDFLLPLSIPSPTDFARRRFRRRWMRFIDQVVAARLARPEAPEARDMFDLLRAARDPETGQGFSPADLRDQTATMILAGHETTALLLFWCLWLLAQAPAAQDRLAAEAAGVSLAPDDAAHALENLPFTRAVISETLRLYPPAFMIVRASIAADNAAGIEIPAGAAVLISPWVLHRHKRLWENPGAFLPERFLGPPPPRFAYLPFGAGPRVCVGAQFAMTEALLALAVLVRHFHIGLLDKEPVLPRPVIVSAPDRAPAFHLSVRSPVAAALALAS